MLSQTDLEACTIKLFIYFCLGSLLAACAQPRAQETVTVAVAANFKPTLDSLEADFEARTDYSIEAVVGSTGKLYAQIVYGAPYDVFLAADQERPNRLIEEQKAIAGSQFTYAVGRLILYGTDDPSQLAAPETKRIAIANPNLAPYGKAAGQVLAELEFSQITEAKLVLGENVGQAFAFLSSGNAQVGFVSEAQILSLSETDKAAFWRPPAHYHDPIAQDAVLLARAEDKPAAIAFVAYLQTDEAKDIIAQHGYDLP
ncbi:MAG: molybdate ABC transporter substrate-binding protein [Henriciella sp.]